MPTGKTPRRRSRLAAVPIAAAVVVALVAPASANEYGRADADLLLDHAAELYEADRFEQAWNTYDEALTMYRSLGASDGVAPCLIGEAWCLFHLGDIDGALPLFEEARDVAESAALLEAAGEAYNGVATCHREFGRQLRAAIRIDEATRHMQAAVDAAELALERFGQVECEAGQGKALATLGSCYGVLGQHEVAIGYYDACLDLLSDPSDQAGVLLTLGQLHALCLDYQRAFDVQSSAVQMYRTLGDPSGLAAGLYHRGYCAMRLTEYQICITATEEALEIYSQAADAPWMAACLNNIGMCLRLLSDYWPAIEAFTRSLPPARAVAAAGGGTRLEADALYGLSLCHMALGNLDDAIASLVECLPIYRQVGRQTNDWVGLANCYGALGNCAARQVDPDPAVALKHFEQAQYYYGRIRNATGMASALVGAGEVYEMMGELATADAHFRDALDLAANYPLPENAWRAHWGLGRIARLDGLLDEARGHYEAAIAIVEGIRARVGMERQASSYFAGVRTLYEDFLDLLLEMDATEDILGYAERARTRQLLDMLAGGGTEAANDAYGATSGGAVDGDEISTRIDEAWSLLTPDEAIVVYAWGTDHLFMWVAKNDGVGAVVAQPVRQAEVIDRICAFRLLLEGSATDRWRARQELVWLHSLLLSPIEDDLAGTSTLVFVPSGALWFVPFTALCAAQGAPHVIETHAVAYVPSIASIPSLLADDTEPSDTSTLGLTALDRVDAQLPPIEPVLAAQLADAVRATTNLLASGEASFLDSVAENDAVRALSVGRPDYVVFACHGVFRADNPPFSYLALMPDETEGGEDGNLEAREILQIEGLEDSELAVLMACETFLASFASKDQTAGLEIEPEEERRRMAWNLTRADELVGLSRSFLLAGCDAVLATHWQVYVPAAIELLPRLGAELVTSSGKATALRQAQLGLMDLPEFAADPWKWSPFVLIGNWR